MRANSVRKQLTETEGVVNVHDCRNLVFPLFGFNGRFRKLNLLFNNSRPHFSKPNTTPISCIDPIQYFNFTPIQASM